MSSPAEDIATYLSQEGVGTLGTNLFFGKMPDQNDVAASAVAVFDSGAVYINPRWSRDEFLVQVLVRGAERDYDSGYSLAKSVQDTLLGIDPVTINGNNYVLLVLIGGINALGNDSRERSQFSLNFKIVAENIPGGVRETF